MKCVNSHPKSSARKVLVGHFGGLESPARRDSEHVGVELAFRRPGSVLPLRREYEHALIVLDGSLRLDGAVVEPGVLHPDSIHTPGIYVQRIINGSPYDKKIEKLTVRKRTEGSHAMVS